MHLLKHPQRQALLLIFVLFGLILQSAFAMEKTRLSVAATKNLDAQWALQLDDGEDTAATAYLTNAAEAGAEQTPLTFLNQDGKQQPLFRAQGDDYWRPDRYAQEALSYSKSHDRFPGHNLRGNITRSVWQGVTDQAGETGRALGEQITTAPWATVKAVSGAMASGAWAVARHPLQSAENFGKEVLRLGKDAAFNLGSGTTSAWAGYRGAENPLNELYGQNMGPALLSLGSAQGVLTAAQVIPMMKGAQALGKGALKGGVKGVGKLGDEAADIAVGSVVTKKGAGNLKQTNRAANALEDYGQNLNKTDITKNGQKLLETPRDVLLRNAKDQRLKDAINNLYRPGAKVGSGSTADAVRFERGTGKLLSPKGHTKKLIGRRTQLVKLRKDPKLSNGDRRVIDGILKDIQGALSN